MEGCHAKGWIIATLVTLPGAALAQDPIPPAPIL